MKCPICGERGIPFYKKFSLLLAGEAKCKSCNTRFKGTNTYILLILGIYLVISPIDRMLEYINLTFIVIGGVMIASLILPIGKGMEVVTEKVVNAKVERTKKDKWISIIFFTAIAGMLIFLFFPRSMVKISKIPEPIESASLRMFYSGNITAGGMEAKSNDSREIEILVNNLKDFTLIRNPFNCGNKDEGDLFIGMKFNNGYRESLYIVQNNCVFIDNVHYSVINKDIDYDFLKEFFRKIS